MKKIVTAIIFLCVSLCSFAQEETGSRDNNSGRVKDGRVHLDFDIPFYHKFDRHRDHMDLHMLGIGAMKSFAPAPYSFNPFNSLDIFGYVTDDVRMGGSCFFSWGAGIGWKTFTLTGDTAMFKTADGKIGTGPYPEGTVPKLSRLRVFSFGFPLMFSCNVGNGFGFSLGPIIDLNVDSCINKKYYYNGKKLKDKYKNAHCNLATVDLMFQLNLKKVGLWVKYSPMSIMDTAYWPEIQTLSFGVAL